MRMKEKKNDRMEKKNTVNWRDAYCNVMPSECQTLTALYINDKGQLNIFHNRHTIKFSRVWPFFVCIRYAYMLACVHLSNWTRDNLNEWKIIYTFHRDIYHFSLKLTAPIKTACLRTDGVSEWTKRDCGAFMCDESTL